MKRLIVFLIRKRLGLKKYQPFKFTNQKDDCVYFFADDRLLKRVFYPKVRVKRSNVSLNWIERDNYYPALYMGLKMQDLQAQIWAEITAVY